MRGYLITLCWLLLIAFLGWKAFYPTSTYRYRLTVEIDTPEGTRSGSSVIETKVIRYPSWVTLGHTDHEFHMRGEAVTVDLGERGMLFAILRGNPWGEDYAKRLPFELFGKNPKKHDKAELPPGNMPTMVTFTGKNDPMSVKLAYQAELDWQASTPSKGNHYIFTNNMHELFGEGVNIARVTVEMTDDPVTMGIETQLPWLTGYYGKQFDGSRHDTHMPKTASQIA